MQRLKEPHDKTTREQRLTMSETQRAIDAEPERELIRLLREAGASDEFITVIRTNPEDTEAKRNSCRNEINKWVRWNDGEIDEDALQRPGFGGGFFEKMWNGNVYHAYNHSDANNKAILREAFGLGYINRQRPPNYPEVTA